MNIILSALALAVLLTSCSKPGGDNTPPAPIVVPESQVDLNATQQTIQGFGGATVFRPDLTDADVNTLFGNSTDNQLGLSILRIRVNPYGSSQWGQELYNALRAKSYGAIVMATPWSPPAFMKTNNNTTGGKLSIASYGAYAAYLKSFADYMKNSGAELYALSIQNEPDIQVGYESCDWTAQEMTDFIKANSFDFGNTKLMAAESFNFNQSFTDVILNDAAAAPKVGIIGGHIYGSGLRKYDNAINKGKEVWMTEHLDTLTTWASVLATAKEIHDCLAVANYNAYIWWYMKRFYGPVDESSNITKRGYVMAQFTKYIRKGYQRVSATSPYTDVFISAYKGNGKMVIVAINTSTSSKDIKFTLNGTTVPSSVTPHITSITKSLSSESTINITSAAFTYTLPGSAVVTFASN
ncbi:MAG: glucuronoxylanase XynC [Candidatus Dadabacteria bacterium]